MTAVGGFLYPVSQLAAMMREIAALHGFFALHPLPETLFFGHSAAEIVT
ncbi:hypothetical protein GUA87_03870 [Sneathiella sp. P13V-1]|nr:hypothetical protein [Sneathiella sp. P13V-1]MBE7635967.1 hypothetical protein [Sneathiella sp. P13V-1]